MIAFWVHRNGDGIVEGGSVAEHTDASLLRRWRSFGWTVELVEANTLTIEAQLPSETRIIQVLKGEKRETE